MIGADARKAAERLSAIRVTARMVQTVEIGRFGTARSLNERSAADQRSALSVSQARRSCSLVGVCRRATATVPSKTSGPRNAFISLSWKR